MSTNKNALKELRFLIRQAINENQEISNNYMYWQNIKTIHHATGELLKMDKEKVDSLLSDGHGWALDHIATSADDIEEVYHFLEANLESHNATSDVLDETNPCWDGYKQIGMKEKNGKQVPNCVPMNESSILKEERIDDFFEFLAQNPQRKSMATVFYTAPVKLNKYITNENGEKESNPMFGKLFKHQRIRFKWDESYKDAALRVNPDFQFGNRSGEFSKSSGFDVLEQGKSGFYLPVVPTGSDSVYSVLENGQMNIIDKNEAYRYMPTNNSNINSASSDSGKPDFRQLILKRIYAIKAGGNSWVNPEFEYDYVGPTSEL